MPDLNAEQLTQIQTLVADPLKETVRAEMRTIADGLAKHITDSAAAALAYQTKLHALESRVGLLESAQVKVKIVYSVIGAGLGIAGDYLLHWLTPSKH